MEEQRRQFIPGLGILLLAALLLGAIGALLHDYREVEYRGVGALLWGGAVLITFVLGTVHLSRRVLPLQNNLGWAEGFRLLWRSYLMGANALLAGRRHEPLHTTTKSKKPSATTLSPSFQLLGAGFLFSHQAAAITRGNSFVRADGPGLVFLHPGEAIAQIFDLRTQSRKQPVEATTRDGILVKTSVSVSFHVRRLPPGERRPRSVETDTIPYPYDRQALFDLTYAGSVAGEEGRLSWADQICPQAATLLVGEIGRFTLDQLLVSGAAEPMGEIKANIKRGLEAMQTSEDGPTLPKGVTIASVGVGGVELPEDVVTKRLGTWQVEWHSQATGDIAVATIETQRLVNRARARAVADSIDSLLSSIETVQAQGQGGQLHEVILQQLTKSLETVLTKQVISDLPQRAQLMNLASSTSHELRRALERGE
ncbi:MAG: hypothetical protein KBG73_10865 [Candidatus Promineofilum sp.]|nr:hypothetical protein [Promineifilum sp.]